MGYRTHCVQINVTKISIVFRASEIFASASEATENWFSITQKLRPGDNNGMLQKIADSP